MFTEQLQPLWRRRSGRNACEEWIEAGEAIAGAKSRDDTWRALPVAY